MYSELNFLWESWLKVKTNNSPEAIENKTQGKTLLEYHALMLQCFQEYFRVLKPGKWMTVEFSNTSAAVWNGIQTAIQRAGFIIANVAALDKQQGSFKAVTTTTAVKQDLVISCYKPTYAYDRIIHTNNVSTYVWDFITDHLNHLPIHISNKNKTQAIIERSSKILYDRLISYYIMKNQPVPIDAADFREGLQQKFKEEDGMFFTAEQYEEYQIKKVNAPQVVQYTLIVTTEAEGIVWLQKELSEKPSTYQDIQPKWMKTTTAVRKGDILPELKQILSENFIQTPEQKWRTPDTNEAKDRETMRNKVLLKEYQSYIDEIKKPKAKKLKSVRVEALRAGFKNSHKNNDKQTIIELAEKIPQNILMEDEVLLMYYDLAMENL
jgi:hypothetical protein